MITDLFDQPLRKVKVRNDVYAYQYRSGIINIDGQKFCFYSMTEAIKRYRNKKGGANV